MKIATKTNFRDYLCLQILFPCPCNKLTMQIILYINNNHCCILHRGIFIESRPISSGNRLVFSMSAAERFTLCFWRRTRSIQPLWLCSDRNMPRNWMACHVHLFTVFARLNAEWKFYGKACICSVFVNLVMFIKLYVIW